MGQSWMSKLLTWIRFAKHPDTHPTIYRNVRDYDQVRAVLKGRCHFCDFVISSDAQKVREVYVQAVQKTEHVYDLCYALHHSLYLNYGLKNMNYFRNIDEAEQKEQQDRRRRMS